MSISTTQNDLALNRSFELSGANDAMRYMNGEMEPLQISGLGSYLKSVTPGIWQSIGPSIEAITPLLTENQVDDGHDYDECDYEMV